MAKGSTTGQGQETGAGELRNDAPESVAVATTSEISARTGGGSNLRRAPNSERIETVALQVVEDLACEEDGGEDAVVTALEYLQEQEALEKKARKLYPKKFDKCTFALGYLNQPIYGCLSVKCRQSGQPAGFCYACSISCHADHDVIELFSKRHFRCDCGTARSPNTACTLLSPEDERRRPEHAKHAGKPTLITNAENSYNHNFDGRYCWCDQPYNAETEESTMFQCVVCQDWRHGTCIGLVPPEDSFDEYVCSSCTAEYPFLKRYRKHALVMGMLHAGGNRAMSGFAIPGDGGQVVLFVDAGSSVNVDFDVETDEAKAEACLPPDSSAVNPDVHSSTCAANTDKQNFDSRSGSPKPSDVSENSEKRVNAESKHYERSSTKRLRSLSMECRWESLPDVEAGTNVDLFCRAGWRQKLCQCQACVAYFGNSLRFLLEDEDEYEPEDDEEDESVFNRGMKAFGELPHSTQVEGALAYRRMRDEVMGLLSTFAHTGRAVTREDVVRFFEQRCTETLAHRSSQPGQFF